MFNPLSYIFNHLVCAGTNVDLKKTKSHLVCARSNVGLKKRKTLD
jgi:hypothetical protein